MLAANWCCSFGTRLARNRVPSSRRTFLRRGRQPPSSWGSTSRACARMQYPEATVAADSAAYPVLLLSPSGFPPLMLSAIAEELASHGFIVVGVNHTLRDDGDGVRRWPCRADEPGRHWWGTGAAGGLHTEIFRQRASVCEYKAADLASVADQLENLNTDPTERFTGRLDLARLGALGHSFGGNAALE